MIWESCYWKEPLLASSKYLRRVRITEKTIERTLVRIEKEILLGFYSVRKLLDTYKVSDSSKKLKYEIIWHKNIKPITYFNWHHVEELYDLKTRNSETRYIRFICDQFIHSYIFLPVDKESKLAGFYVTTDRLKNQKCYYVNIDHVVSIFRTIGRDYPANFKQWVDPKSGEIVGSAW
jgi:hypothetical protein